MNFRFRTIGTALALLLAGGMTLGAQDVEQTFKAGFINPQGDFRTLTQSPAGYGFEYNFDFKPSEENGIGLGLVAGWLNAPGKKSAHGNFLQPNGSATDGNGNADPLFVNGSCNVKATYVGADILYAVSGTPVTIRTGPMLVSWDVTQRNPPITGTTGSMGESNFKLGWRIGADYRISKEWSASITYSQAHWLNTTTDAYNANNVFQSNPSWLTIMAGYKF